LTHWAISKFQQKEKQPYIFYMHPWEIDTEQPRIRDVSLKARFRHYVNIDRVERRLHKLLSQFEWGAMRDVLPGD